MARAMTPEEHARIADAVQAAEAKTSGEIYCVVARSSDSYFFPAAFMVTLASSSSACSSPICSTCGGMTCRR